MIRASCHCGAVVMEADRLPRSVTSCNCSICRRLGALWAYYTRKTARIVTGTDNVSAYVWGDKTIEFCHCKICGCATHYESGFAINGCCFAPEDLAGIAVRHFDGADTWKYLD
jgi:hypothetical protein